MARRNSGNSTTSPVKEAVNEATEGTAPESTESTTETPVEAPKAEKKEIDLTAFQSAANEAVSSADSATGDLPEESLEAVNKVYREIDGLAGKNAARAWLDGEMKAAILGKDILRARSIVNLKDGLSAGSGGGTKTPADPTTAFVQKVAALNLALTLATDSVPDGVDSEWHVKADELLAGLTDDVEKYKAYVESDDEDAEAPDVSPVVRQAFKLASGRGTSGNSGRVSGGPRRDIEKHLIQVFEDLPVGSFLKISEIAKTASVEYGDDRPSAGAVSARLFPKGREPYNANGIQATAEPARGATKTA